MTNPTEINGVAAGIAALSICESLLLAMGDLNRANVMLELIFGAEALPGHPVDEAPETHHRHPTRVESC